MMKIGQMLDVLLGDRWMRVRIEDSSADDFPMATALTTDGSNNGLFRFDAFDEESMSALGLSCAQVDEWIAADIQGWSECCMRYSYSSYYYDDDDEPEHVQAARRKIDALRAREVYVQTSFVGKKAVVVWPTTDEEPKSFAIVGATTLCSTTDGQSFRNGYRHTSTTFLEWRPCFTRTLQACAHNPALCHMCASALMAYDRAHADGHRILRRSVDDQEAGLEGAAPAGCPGVARWADGRAGGVRRTQQRCIERARVRRAHSRAPHTRRCICRDSHRRSFPPPPRANVAPTQSF
jgi:hypothetical protein